MFHNMAHGTFPLKQNFIISTKTFYNLSRCILNAVIIWAIRLNKNGKCAMEFNFIIWFLPGKVMMIQMTMAWIRNSVDSFMGGLFLFWEPSSHFFEIFSAIEAGCCALDSGEPFLFYVLGLRKKILLRFSGPTIKSDLKALVTLLPFVLCASWNGERIYILNCETKMCVIEHLK